MRRLTGERGDGKSPRLQVTVSEKTFRRLEAISKATGATISWLARQAVEGWLELQAAKRT